MNTGHSSFFRSFTAALLALSLLLGLLPAFAETQTKNDFILEDGAEEGSYHVSGKYVPTDTRGFTNSGAFSDYVNGAMYFSGASAKKYNSTSVLGSRLTGSQKTLYDAMVPKVKNVAAGKTSSTVFSVSSYKPKFTLQSVDWNADILDSKIGAHIRNVVLALLGDCPSELYWFDKTVGWAWDYDIRYDSTYCWIANFYIAFAVAKEYSASNQTGTTRTDPKKGQAVQNAAANAKKIMQKYRGKSDTEKMRGYKDEICILNDYNYAALDDSVAYGNPWQLVWVFDGNPSTNVVCEGYSKAFQYLCELTAFSGSITVMSVCGDLYVGSSNLGGHMWNVVTMSNGYRYLVDVTNCDENASGQPGTNDLFLAGYKNKIETSAGTRYVYADDVGYVFDKDIPKLISSEKDQQLHNTDYDPATDPVLYTGKCGADAEWSLNKSGVLKIAGTGNMTNYSRTNPAPWKQYAGMIKKITVGNSITRIGNYAFCSLGNVTSAAIGKKVKEIGVSAFSYCKKLATVTINSTVLKKVGKNAFCNLAAKAKFVIQKKYRSAYKKLIKKGNPPKKAVYK